jgi:hypothetical protein
MTKRYPRDSDNATRVKSVFCTALQHDTNVCKVVQIRLLSLDEVI